MTNYQNGEYQLLDPQKVFEIPDAPFVQVLKDRWWIVDERGRVVFWMTRDRGKVRLYPQCNINRAITERFLNRIQKEFDDVGTLRVEQRPVGFVPVRLEDYS